MPAYYNEIDGYLCDWLRNLIAAGHLPSGEVDCRPIQDVQPDDLIGYDQAHFFAGVGGWPYALRLAGWPDGRSIWSASCPCQPFSNAGQRRGADDPRHLWPHFFRLVEARRLAFICGEQVGGALGYRWLDGVFADLENSDYTCEAADIPACAVNAPHRRNRIYWVAVDDAEGKRLSAGASVTFERSAPSQSERSGRGILAAAKGIGGSWTGIRESCRSSPDDGFSATNDSGTFWSDAEWVFGADGKSRRVEPGLLLMVDGFPGRIPQVRAFGNAIVPPLAAEFIRAIIDIHPC